MQSDFDTYCTHVTNNPFSHLLFRRNTAALTNFKYQADDLRVSLTSIRFSHIHFFGSIFAYQDSAIHVYGHTCAFPDKTAQMYFGRVSPKAVLGMIEFLQIVETVVGQLVCADLSVSSRFYNFAKTRSNNYRNFSHLAVRKI